LQQDFHFAHYSAGQLLRDECASGSETGERIKDMLREGQIVPSEVTIGLLKNAMLNSKDSNTFLIDGFPRNIDQGATFEREVRIGSGLLLNICRYVLWFGCL
jgi:adenylate kinase family enzyme